MKQTPYQPMHPPRKAVSQADMWETLAKHSPSEVELHREKVGQTPKAELRPPLEWCAPVKTGPKSAYELSRCGGFSVTKFDVLGKPMYEAWKRKDPPHESISLGIRPDRKEAEHLCENAR